MLFLWVCTMAWWAEDSVLVMLWMSSFAYCVVDPVLVKAMIGRAYGNAFRYARSAFVHTYLPMHAQTSKAYNLD